MNEIRGTSTGLRRVLGFAPLYIITVGIVVSQSSVVSILQGAGLGGGTFFIAILIAFILALCYISTYSELALIMPKAGTISTYTAVAIGHFPAIIAALSAYVAPALFGSIAELLLLQYVVDTILPGYLPHIAIMIMLLFALLNILGIDLFASVQSVISFTMLVTLVVIGFVGLNIPYVSGVPPKDVLHQFLHPDASVFSLLLVALWPFIGFELVCDFIEEAKDPARHMRKAMLTAGATIFFAYCLIAFAAMKLVSPGQLSDSGIPHLLLGQAIFGDVGKVIILVLSITTTCGFISTGFATTPRLLYGMAQQKQLPVLFSKLHPRWRTPWFGVLILTAAIAVGFQLLVNKEDALLMLVVSGASCYLLAYIIAHIDLIVLRRRYPDHPRPFRSSRFPFVQVLGIIGMVYAFINNAPTPGMRQAVYINVAIFITVVAIYAFFWVKYRMKTGMFRPEAIEDVTKD